jgi:hypothetical protein
LAFGVFYLLKMEISVFFFYIFIKFVLEVLRGIEWIMYSSGMRNARMSFCFCFFVSNIVMCRMNSLNSVVGSDFTGSCDLLLSCSFFFFF